MIVLPCIHLPLTAPSRRRGGEERKKEILRDNGDTLRFYRKFSLVGSVSLLTGCWVGAKFSPRKSIFKQFAKVFSGERKKPAIWYVMVLCMQCRKLPYHCCVNIMYSKFRNKPHTFNFLKHWLLFCKQFTGSIPLWQSRKRL